MGLIYSIVFSFFKKKETDLTRLIEGSNLFPLFTE